MKPKPHHGELRAEESFADAARRGTMALWNQNGGGRGRRLGWCLLGPLICLTLRAETPSTQPRNFGVKDGSVHEDPRDAMRGDFPMWSVSKELPNDVFTFARLRYNSYSYGGR